MTILYHSSPPPLTQDCVLKLALPPLPPFEDNTSPGDLIQLIACLECTEMFWNK